MRKAVSNNVKKSFNQPHARDCWSASLQDVALGFASGPYYHQDEVSAIPDDKHWIAMPRFPVLQNGKVRPVDDGRPSGSNANSFSALTEKLQVTSKDHIITACKIFYKSMLEQNKTVGEDSKDKVGSCDESKAFRQIPVHPNARKLAVVTMWDPTSNREAFFIMIGHLFGLTASVMNFNRRAVALTYILQKYFMMPALSYFDDRFGIARGPILDLDTRIVLELCNLLGVAVNSKTQKGHVVDLLGVTFDHNRGVIDLKEERRIRLIDESEEIIKNDLLTPGHPGKLRGKLMYIAGH